MLKKRYIGLIALGVVLLLAGTFLAQALTIYPSQVIAKPKGSPVGVAPFTDRVDFGDIPQGENVGKSLIMENKGTVTNQVYVFVMGSVGQMVKIDPSSFTLAPGKKQEVKLRLSMPDSATPEKTFTGRVIVLRLPKGL